MRKLFRALSRSIVAAAVAALAGCGGGGSEVHAGAGVITITAFAPLSIPGGAPTPFTITGTNFETVTGTTAQVIFHALGGATPFLGGGSDTATVLGLVTSDTTITGTTPAATICGVASISIEVTVILESGVKSNTFTTVGLVITAPTVTGTTPGTIPAINVPPTISVDGTGFGPVGGTATVRFISTPGNDFFGDGTLPEVAVVGTIASATSITVAPPKATICGPTFVTVSIQVTFDATGSCSAVAPAALRYDAPAVTSFSTAGTGGGANIARQTLSNTFNIGGTGFGPNSQPVKVRFFGPSLVFAVGNGSLKQDADVSGIINGPGAIQGTTPLAVSAAPFTATVQVFFQDGTCTNAFGPITFNPPPVITTITNANAPFSQTAVGTLQTDRFLGVVNTQMNIAGANFVGAPTVLVYQTALSPAFPIGTGALGAPVVNAAALITGQSPTDATLTGTVPTTVRVTNPDGQFGEAGTTYVTSAVRPNFNTSFDTGTNSENQIAVNPANPLNAVALAHQIATGGFVNMNASVTIDGGLTWTKVLIGNTQDGLTLTFRGDPMVGFDAFGNCYMNYIATGGGTDRVMLIQFAPAAGTVTAAILGALAANVRTIQTSAGSALNQDRNTISVGGPAATQTIACGHIDFSGFPAVVNGRCAAFTSTGAGLLSAATGPVTVASDTAARFVQNFAPCVGPLGQVYVSWVDADKANNANPANVNFVGDFNGVTGGLVFGATTLVGVSDLGWRTFITAQPNRGNGTVPMSVAINTGAKTGRIVITYADEVPAIATEGSSGAPVANNTVVVTQFSDTQGITWSPKTFVRPATLDHHFLPWLGLDTANGNCYVTWKETADQPTRNQSVRFCASATDGNAWNAPLRISQGVATPFVAFNGAAGDYLEYEGIAAFGHRCYAVWADNANFTTTGATANPHGSTTSDAYVSVFQHKP